MVTLHWDVTRANPITMSPNPSSHLRHRCPRPRRPVPAQTRVPRLPKVREATLKNESSPTPCSLHDVTFGKGMHNFENTPKIRKLCKNLQLRRVSRDENFENPLKNNEKMPHIVFAFKEGQKILKIPG